MSEFICPVPPVALTPTQKRVIVKWKFPGTDDEVKRAVIVDSEDGRRWYETQLLVCQGVRVRPSLHMAHDLGSVGYPGALWLLGKACVRGTLIWDRWHVMMSELEAATAASKLTLIKAQCAFEMNLRRVPFKKDINDSKLHAAGMEFFTQR